MYTLLVRDEHGNMKIIHDWHNDPKPHLLSHSACCELAQKIRLAYPNASYGLEFSYYFTGDSRLPLKPTRITVAFDALPDFRDFVLHNHPQPDCHQRRMPLPRTAPHSRSSNASLQKDSQKAPKVSRFTCRFCRWSGSLSEIQEKDTDSIYVVDWTCPNCGNQQSSRWPVSEVQPPINTGV